MSDVAVIYPCFNRLFYTQITLPRILDECRISKRFNHLYLYDDMSTDGTSEFIDSLQIEKLLPGQYTLIRTKIGNSLYQTNSTAKRSSCPYMFKIDNDTLIPEGAIDRGVQFLDFNCNLAFLGLGYQEIFPARSRMPKIVEPVVLESASFIGGIGFFRRCVFSEFGFIKKRNRFYGSQGFQRKAIKGGWKAAWVNGIWIMDLDNSPTYSRVNEYAAKGWGRNIVGTINSVFEPTEVGT